MPSSSSNELDDSPTLAEAALEKLVYIYEREQEWQKAIDAQRKLEMLRGTKSNQVAHYYCELADASARARRPRARARAPARPRFAARSGQLRGTLIRAGLAQEERDFTRGDRRSTSRSSRRIATSSLRCCRRLIECYRTHRQAAVLRREDRELDRADRDAAPRLRVCRDHRQSRRPPTRSKLRRELRSR